MNRTHLSPLATLFLGVAATVGVLTGQQESPSDLVKALQSGGHVLIMRHASSPREVPSKATANPDNSKLERQLDEAGRRGATELGDALRALQIPIGVVLTSPTYRTMETVSRARLAPSVTVPELGDGGQGMQGISEAQAQWLRSKAAEVPRSGNALLVTHQPNLALAFPAWASTMAEGEMLVLHPDGRGGTSMIGRITIDSWSKMR